MPDLSLLAVLGLGFLLGLKHAADADHIAAVTTLVAEQKEVGRSFAIGALWGLGHTLSLFVAACLVVLLRVRVSDQFAAWLELGVAVMLVILGLRHIRPRHSHPANPTGFKGYGLRPLIVGAVHGAAGSAALTLLVLSTISSSLTAMVYVAVFGLGSMVGMAGVTALMSLPLYFARERILQESGRVRFAAGFASCLFGLYLISTHFS